MSSEGLFSVLGRLWEEYRARTPQRLKLVDAYLAYIMATGIIQFLYCLLVGTFPFNSFLSGFISCVGSFVLTGKSGLLVLACCCILIGAHRGLFPSLCSVLADTIQPPEQGPVCKHQSRESLWRFHHCQFGPALGCHQFHRMKQDHFFLGGHCMHGYRPMITYNDHCTITVIMYVNAS